MIGLAVTDTHFQDHTTEAIHRAFWQSVNANEKFDAIFHSGDFGLTELSQVEQAFKVLREENPEKPIFGVLGNHDLWSSQKSLSLETRMGMIKNYALNYGIDLIERNPYEGPEYWVVGLMGWYNSLQAPTRDREFLPLQTSEGAPFVWLQKHAHKSFTEIQDLDFKGKKVIFLSHFGMDGNTMDRPDLSADPYLGKRILEMADVYLFGHSHKAVDLQIGKTRIINAGATYGQTPPYKLFEL